MTQVRISVVTVGQAFGCRGVVCDLQDRELATTRVYPYIRYARQQTQPAGGALSWAGGVRGPDGRVRWYRRDGAEVSS